MTSGCGWPPTWPSTGRRSTRPSAWDWATDGVHHPEQYGVRPAAGTCTLRSCPGQALAGRGWLSERLDAGDFNPAPPFYTMAEAIGNYLAAIGIRTQMRTMERAAL